MKMNLRQKQIIVISVVLTFVLVGAGGFLALRSKTVADGEQLSVNEIGQAKSAFSLDEAATNGWYMGPASEKDLAIFGKNSGNKPADKESMDSHFAMIAYIEDGKSEEDTIRERIDGRRKSHSATYELVIGDVLPAVLETTDGPLHYELRTYRNQLKPGVADPGEYGLNEAEVHGYIPYGDGWLRVQGYATPASLLTDVIEAIKALKLDTDRLPNISNRQSNESTQSDKCTDRDWEIGNCVRAGQCNPNRDIDYVIDCELKDYDRKFNLDAM